MKKIWICPRCKAKHLYHYTNCGNCGRANKKPPQEVIKPNYSKTRESFFKSYDQVAALCAMVMSCRQLQAVRMRKSVIIDSMRRTPALRAIIRTVYDPNVKFGFTWEDAKAAKIPTLMLRGNLLEIIRKCAEMEDKDKAAGRWRKMIAAVGPPFNTILNSILDKDLRLGVSVKGLNFVLKRLDSKPIPKRRKRS